MYHEPLPGTQKVCELLEPVQQPYYTTKPFIRHRPGSVAKIKVFLCHERYAIIPGMMAGHQLLELG